MTPLRTAEEERDRLAAKFVEWPYDEGCPLCGVKVEEEYRTRHIDWHLRGLH